MRKKNLLSVFLLVIMLALASCSGKAPASSEASGTGIAASNGVSSETSDPSSDTDDALKPVYGGTLTVCDNRTVNNIGYPPYMSSGSPIRHASPALETLFQLNERGEIQPKLALSYEEDPKALTLTIHLRSGVTFHDGTIFDAYAVRWNLEQQLVANATGTTYIEKLEVVDEQTLRIHMTLWDNTLLPSLCQAQGLMISPDAFKKNGGTEWAASHPVGTGPFIFQNRDENGTITYTRNPDYWDHVGPYLDSIVVLCDSDASSREYGLRSGVYDVLIRGDLTSLAGLSAEGYTINAIPSTGPWGIIFDSANEESPFSDLRVRQAVSYAIDKNYLIRNIYLGTVTETNQYALPGTEGYNDAVVGYGFDLTRAAQLMSDAGYEDGFTTTFNYDATADNADALANALQDMLAEINITLELHPVTNAKSTAMLQKGVGWSGIMGTFGSAQYDTLTQLNNYMMGDLKYASMKKPQELIDNIEHALSADTLDASKYIRKVQSILVDEECLCCYFFANIDYTVISSTVHDTGFSSLMPVTMWTPAAAWKDE